MDDAGDLDNIAGGIETVENGVGIADKWHATHAGLVGRREGKREVREAFSGGTDLILDGLRAGRTT